MNDLEAIGRAFRDHDRFLIACHENPEGDAIGSELALALALRRMGKTATVLNADPVPSNLLFLPGADTILFEDDGTDYPVSVIVDCGSPERTGRVGDVLARSPLQINIDHHKTNGSHGHLRLIDPAAAATGLLIHRLLKSMNEPIGLDVALNIYVSVLTDTGSFHYSSANPEAFRTAGDMVALGIDPWKVSEQLFESQEPNRVRLLGRVLDSLALSPSGKFASITTTLRDLADFSASRDFLEGFINYPRSIAGVEVAVSFREEPDGSWRVSFRSKGRVDVAEVAARFGGGGHRNASGCSVVGSLPQVRERVFGALESALT
ncbi:MAG TPA: bifunctional oligoribonuclease/PAP phosphatase NrnA [Candidatus Deferrimicrobiaceae bacterium]